MKRALKSIHRTPLVLAALFAAALWLPLSPLYLDGADAETAEEEARISAEVSSAANASAQNIDVSQREQIIEDAQETLRSCFPPEGTVRMEHVFGPLPAFLTWDGPNVSKSGDWVTALAERDPDGLGYLVSGTVELPSPDPLYEETDVEDRRQAPLIDVDAVSDPESTDRVAVMLRWIKALDDRIDVNIREATFDSVGNLEFPFEVWCANPTEEELLAAAEEELPEGEESAVTEPDS